MNVKKILFWARGSKELGYGHIYRVVRLAKYLSSRYEVFVLTNENSECIKIVEEKALPVLICDMINVLEILDKSKPDLLVLDQPEWSSKSFMLKLREHVPKIVAFDDRGPGAKYTDVLINAVIGLPEEKPFIGYEGVQYMIFSDEIEHFASLPSNLNKKEYVLVSFGGSDPNNISEIIIEYIKKASFVNFVLVLGKGYANSTEFIKKYSNIPNLSIKYDVDNMPELIYCARCCIVSGGLTLYECLALKKRVLVLCEINQQIVTAEQMKAYGDVKCFGVVNSESKSVLQAVFTKSNLLPSNCVQRLEAKSFDVKGKYRISEIITKLLEGES